MSLGTTNQYIKLDISLQNAHEEVILRPLNHQGCQLLYRLDLVQWRHHLEQDPAVIRCLLSLSAVTANRIVQTVELRDRIGQIDTTEQRGLIETTGESETGEKGQKERAGNGVRTLKVHQHLMRLLLGVVVPMVLYHHLPLLRTACVSV